MSAPGVMATAPSVIATAIARVTPGRHARRAMSAAGLLSAAVSAATTVIGLSDHGRLGVRHATTARAAIGLRLLRPGTALKRDAATVRPARRAMAIGIAAVRLMTRMRETGIGRRTGRSITRWVTAAVRRRDLLRITATATPGDALRPTAGTVDRPRTTIGVATIVMTAMSMPARRIIATDTAIMRQAIMRQAIMAIGRTITATAGRPRRMTATKIKLAFGARRPAGERRRDRHNRPANSTSSVPSSNTASESR